MSDALSIRDLTLSLGKKKSSREILRGISLTIEHGSIHGLAGESGSGKTMTALTVLGLLPEHAQVGGSIKLHSDSQPSVELVNAKRHTLSSIRGKRVAMVFQDPLSSLHPQLTVGAQLTDHMRFHLHLSKTHSRKRAIELLDMVKIPNPEASLKAYAHQFSGGQRQRIAIAVALACDPEVLLADEPTTALDVTVQAGVLKLLRELADTLNIGVLLVTHDLGVLSAVADRITVMKNGEVVESNTRKLLFTAPEHEYTRALLNALPGAIQEGAEPNEQ